MKDLGFLSFFSKSQMAFHLRDKGSQIGFHERKVGGLGFQGKKAVFFPINAIKTIFRVFLKIQNDTPLGVYWYKKLESKRKKGLSSFFLDSSRILKGGYLQHKRYNWG